MFTVREPEDTSIKDAARDKLVHQHWEDLKKSGVSTVAVHYWLTGKCPANVQNIIKVINACGYSVKFKMVKL